MADYHPLIASAVAGLDKNTGEARRTLYDRARTALVAQLRSVDPPLNGSDITRERLALEAAIHKVEAESARKVRSEPARVDPAPEVRAPDAKRWEAASRWDEPAQSPPDEPPHPVRKAMPPAWPEPAPLAPLAPRPPPASSPPMPGSAAGRDQSEAPPPRPRQPFLGDGRSLLDSGLRDFRDVVSEADELGDASARAARAARDSFDAVAAPAAADAGRPAAEQTDVVLTPELLEPQFGADAAEHDDDFEEAPRPPRQRRQSPQARRSS